MNKSTWQEQVNYAIDLLEHNRDAYLRAADFDESEKSTPIVRKSIQGLLLHAIDFLTEVINMGITPSK